MLPLLGLSLGSDLSVVLLGRAAQGQVGDGRSHEDRREGTYDDTEAHGEGETADALSTEEEDTEQHDKRRERGVDRTGQRLADTLVEE